MSVGEKGSSLLIRDLTHLRGNRYATIRVAFDLLLRFAASLHTVTNHLHHTWICRLKQVGVHLIYSSDGLVGFIVLADLNQAHPNCSGNSLIPVSLTHGGKKEYNINRISLQTVFSETAAIQKNKSMIISIIITTTLMSNEKSKLVTSPALRLLAS